MSPGGQVLVPEYHIGTDPAVLLELAKSSGLEGVVGKRSDSPYRPGRSRSWLKHALRELLSG